MSKRASRGVRAWAVALSGMALCGVAMSWACGSADAPADGDGRASNGDIAPSADADEGAGRHVRGADGDEARYQLVDTSDGMTLEVVTPTDVQTFACPDSTCGSVCNECAARACEAVGELSEVCGRLVRDCNATCRCGAAAFSPGSCGFPVCATSGNLCYEAEGGSLPTPSDPEPDPNPITPPGGAADRPSSNAAPNGSGAATPAG